MPEVKYYEVEQLRVVTVRANNEVDAANMATEAFENDLEEIKYPDGRQARIFGKIEVIDLHIRKRII